MEEKPDFEITTVVTLGQEPYDVFVGTRHTSDEHYGNPFSADGHGRTLYVGSTQAARRAFALWLAGKAYKTVFTRRRRWIWTHLRELTGKRIACRCSGDDYWQCHAHVLARVADDPQVIARLERLAKTAVETGTIGRAAAASVDLKPATGKSQSLPTTASVPPKSRSPQGSVVPKPRTDGGGKSSPPSYTRTQRGKGPRVKPGNIVVIEDLATRTQARYLIQPHSRELKPPHSVDAVTYLSPVGKALRGAAVGDVVVVNAPAETLRWRVLKIWSYR